MPDDIWPPDTTGAPGEECAGCGKDLDELPVWWSSSGSLCQSCAEKVEEADVDA